MQKVPTTKTTTTTTTGPSSNSYNNNNNNNDDDAADDDDEDDDNNDNDDNDDSYLVQMKSPSLFPSPDPYRHRRCAKLYNLYTHTYMLYMYVIYIPKNAMETGYPCVSSRDEPGLPIETGSPSPWNVPGELTLTIPEVFPEFSRI